MVMSLNHFQEESRSILHWLRENLQKVPVFIEIDQNAVFL